MSSDLRRWLFVILSAGLRLVGFWPVFPSYLNEYDAYSLSLFGGDFFYVCNSIYRLVCTWLTFFYFIRQMSNFWPAGPHPRADFNEYYAHSFSMFGGDHWYVFNAVYAVSLTCFDLIGRISIFWPSGTHPGISQRIWCALSIRSSMLVPISKNIHIGPAEDD